MIKTLLLSLALSSLPVEDGNWQETAKQAAYTMQSSCNSTVPALTDSGWAPAGKGWINSSFTNCKTLRVDYWTAESEWYPAVLLTEPPLPHCVPTLEYRGTVANIVFRSWLDNEGCLLENVPFATAFRIKHVLDSYTAGWIARNYIEEVYMLPINMVDGFNGSESWIILAIGN